ncbi:MAG: amidohydrolase family protein [Gammaproteobacteria bacterium]|nr:amidohydrolase family protein [Gammaproteobacteria bacterium]
MKSRLSESHLVRKLAILLFVSIPLMAQASIPAAPDRVEGEGPFERLILRGATIIPGTGAPAIGPADIVIEGNRIKDIAIVGYPGLPIDPEGRPAADENTRELDVSGMYVLPGFVDMHGHLGGAEQGTPAEYVLKLWLAHGITTVREPGSGNGLEWTLEHQRRSARNEIAAPRLVPYVFWGMGHDGPITTPEQARDWVESVADAGAEGIKFFGAPPKILKAALEEAQEQGLGTAMHHAQMNVTGANVIDTARWGLDSMEHWYGLPEAMFTDRLVQDYPADYNYMNEYHRFGQAGRLWEQAAEPGSEKWNAVRDELIELDFTIDPTMTIYEASRDLMAARRAEWHDDYTLPSLWEFFQPSRKAHGSYWFDWSTADEIAWKQNFRKWMQFIEDYNNHGGRVTVGSDAGYIFKLYGFGYIEELEMLQEAGLHPLEVIRAATINGAEALGLEDEIGSVDPGKLADLVIVPANPLANFKVLYGTGAIRVTEDNEVIRDGGVRYTIKDGIIYDARALLEDVRNIVAQQKEANGVTELEQPGR